MRLLLVGYGRMGKLVERLAPDHGFEIVGYLDDTNNIGGVGIASAPDADVAVEFSIPSAVADNLPKLAARRMNVVIGTTGWHEHEAGMRKIAGDAGIGVVAASNFSLGVALFQSLVEQAAQNVCAVSAIRRVDPRDSSFGEEGRTIGYGDHAAAGHEDNGLSAPHRHCVEPRRFCSWHPHGRFRWTV